MNITRTELSLLRLADGIASSADIDRLTKQFDEETLESWKNLSNQIGDVLQPSPSTSNSIDIAPAVMESLGLFGEGDENGEGVAKALDSKIVQQALSEGLDEAARSTLEQSIVGLIMDSVLGSTSPGNVVLNEENSEEEFYIELNLQDVSSLADEAIESTVSVAVDEMIDQSTSMATEENIEQLMAEEWSDGYRATLRSALIDTAPDLSNLSDAILSEVLSDDADILRALEDELNLIDDLVDEAPKVSSVMEGSSDDALLADLDQELEQSVVQEERNPSLLASNMDFSAEIPNPVIAERTRLDESNGVGKGLEEPLEMVVEFTEEDEFLNQMAKPTKDDHEEDSDDEVCSVDESFVTEQMLEEQAKGFPLDLMNTFLPDGKAPGADQLDVWSGMTTLVGKPRLRILPDTEDITVVNKVPTPVSELEDVEEKTSNVEFVSSKRIDADSTISKVSIVVLGSFLSVAAAWMVIVLPSLLTQTTSTINTPKRVVTFEVAEVNQLEVEELEVGEDLNVQILQGEGNAPTIIFLDDMEAL